MAWGGEMGWSAPGGGGGWMGHGSSWRGVSLCACVGGGQAPTACHHPEARRQMEAYRGIGLAAGGSGARSRAARAALSEPRGPLRATARRCRAARQTDTPAGRCCLRRRGAAGWRRPRPASGRPWRVRPGFVRAHGSHTLAHCWWSRVLAVRVGALSVDARAFEGKRKGKGIRVRARELQAGCGISFLA